MNETEKLVRALQRMGLEPYAYSGRFMYGATCVAVNVDHPGDHTYPTNPTGWRMDRMGMGYVIYWPEVAWEPAPEAHQP